MGHRGPRVALILVVALCGTSAATGTAHAAGGGASGTVAGLPRSATTLTVRAVSASTGQVAAASRGGAARRFSFALAPGLYLIVGNAHAARGGAYAAISPVVRVGARGVTRVGLAARPAPRAATRRRGASARAASLNSDAVISVGAVTLTSARGSDLSLDAFVLSQIFDPCSSQGVRFVDQSKEVMKAQQVEQMLKDSGRGAADFNYNPLAPTYLLYGEGRASADGNVTITLNLVDLASKALVSRHSASGRIRDLDSVVADVSDQFAQEACGVPIKSRCPRLSGVRLACVTSMTEVGAGGTVSQSITQSNSCPDPSGYSRAAATGLNWRYTWPSEATLGTGGGGVPGDWQIAGAYRVDAMCGLNHEHCSDTVAGSRTTFGSLEPWTVTGSNGRWHLTIPGLAAPAHPNCSVSAIDDPAVRSSAIITTTLRGRPGRPRPRSMIVPFSLSKTLPCGSGCQDSYSLNGRLLIVGEW